MAFIFSLVISIVVGLFIFRLRKVNALLRKLNSQYKEAKQQLKATLDAVPDQLFELDLEGRQYGNHSARTHPFFSQVENYQQKRFQKFYLPTQLKFFSNALAEANKTGVSMGQQYNLESRKGTYWFELSVSRKIIQESQDPRFIVISRDITKRKKHESEPPRVSRCKRIYLS